MSTKNNLCIYENCNNLVGRKGAKGYCRGHYNRLWKYGSPDGYATSIAKRLNGGYDIRSKDFILANSTVGDGCWIYQGSKTRGYARITYKCSSLYIHRLSYELFIGNIPRGLHIDHLCEEKACVNPFHLEPVTPAENIRRAADNRSEYGSKFCRNGHLRSENEVLYTNSKRPQRICRKCNTISSLKSRSKKLQKIRRY